MATFLSYARPDAELAAAVFAALTAAGLDVWFDREALLPGQDFEREIRVAIGKADAILILFSAASRDRNGHYHVELQLALKERARRPADKPFLIPARATECQLPPELESLNYADLFPDPAEGIRRIRQAIAAIEQRNTRREQDTPPSQPAARGWLFCPDPMCPGHLPIMTGDRVTLAPKFIESHAQELARCRLCGEVLKGLCANCSAPVEPGVCCGQCGCTYVNPPSALDVRDIEDRTRLRNLLMNQLGIRQ